MDFQGPGYKIISSAVIAAIAIAILALLLEISLNPILKFALAAVSLWASGKLLERIWGIKSTGGLLLVKSKAGLEIIDKIAKKAPNFWKAFADTGLVFGFGLLSLGMFGDVRKRKSYYMKIVPFGLLVLLFSSFFVTPSIAPLASSLITGIDLASAGKGAASQELISIILPLSIAVLIIGGIWLFSMLGLLYYSGIILSALGSLAFGNPGPISTTQPGASLLLPGVNLPLFEGLLALAILLVVHEASHGILARLANIRLDSAGIVLFGILPVGAFIDPDEKELSSAGNLEQKRVLVAGSSANFATAFISFALLLIFIVGFGVKELPSATDGLFGFVYRTLALLFILNFIVGVVNLLPLPFFDGQRLIELSISNPLVVRALTTIVAGAFLLNFVPWIFR